MDFTFLKEWLPEAGRLCWHGHWKEGLLLAWECLWISIENHNE